MNSNYMQVVTMRHYDDAGTPEEKREIAKGFEDALDKTAELNAKYIAEIASLKAENERLKANAKAEIIAKYDMPPKGITLEDMALATEKYYMLMDELFAAINANKKLTADIAKLKEENPNDKL